MKVLADVGMPSTFQVGHQPETLAIQNPGSSAPAFLPFHNTAKSLEAQPFSHCGPAAAMTVKIRSSMIGGSTLRL